MAKKAAYVIFQGKETGIFNSWQEVSPLVTGFPHAIYKGYETREAAETAYEAFLRTGDKPYGNQQKPVGKKEPSRLAEEDPMDFYEIHTDGGALTNPGPGGYAFVILNRKGQILTEAFGAMPGQTNNRMELMAAFRALERIPEGSTVDFRADSVYVRQGMENWWQNWENKNLWSLKENTDIIKPLWELVKKRKLVFGPKDQAHRKALPDGKYEFPFNKICDKLSNYGEMLAEKGENGLYFLIQDGNLVDERAILVADLDDDRHGYTVLSNGERIAIS